MKEPRNKYQNPNKLKRGKLKFQREASGEGLF